MVAADCENARPDTQRARRKRAKLRRRSREGMRRRRIRNAGGAGTTPPRLASTARARAAVNTAKATRSADAETIVHNPRSIAYSEYIEVCCVVMLTRACSGGRNVFPVLATRLKPCNDADQHDSRRCPPVSSVGASEIRDAVYSRYMSRLSFGVIVSGSELRWQHIASTGRACRRPTLPATHECAVGRHRGPCAPGRRLARTSNLAGRIRCRYELAAHHAVANIDAGVRHDWARERAAHGAWLRTRRVRPLPARCRGQSGWPNDFRSPSSTTKS